MNNRVPNGGEVVAVNIDGKMYINPANADYLKSQSPSSLNKIESKTINHTGFSKSEVVNGNEKSKREKLLDRLAILQNTEARLVKDLERTRSVIKSIETDLSI